MNLEAARTLKLGARIQFTHNIIKSETYKGTVLLADETVGIAVLFDDGGQNIIPYADRRWNNVELVPADDPSEVTEDYILVLKAQARKYTDDNYRLKTPTDYIKIENAFLLGALIAKGLS